MAITQDVRLTNYDGPQQTKQHEGKTLMATLIDHFPNASHLLQTIAKKSTHGEGSRGGHIIGHTKSGKPIYAGGEHASKRGFHPSTAGFSAADHSNAMAAHLKQAGIAKAAGDRLGARNHMKAFDEHESLRQVMRSHPGISSQEHQALADKHDKAARSLLLLGANEKSPAKAQELKKRGGMHLDLASAHDHIASAQSAR